MSANGSLVAQLLDFSAIASEPIELAEHSGSSLRGAFFGALWRRFCVNKDAPTCVACPLMQSCPVSSLVAPLREDNPRGRDIPRPYVLRPPDLSGHGGPTAQVKPKQPFSFSLTLLGTTSKLFPYVLLAAQVMGHIGLGRTLSVNKGRRGRFSIARIDAHNPFNGERQPLYTDGRTVVTTPSLAVTQETVAARAATLPPDRLTLRFLTPTRLIAEGQLTHTPHFRTLALRLAERLEAITREYGADGAHPAEHDTAGDAWRERYQRIAQLASSVRLVHNDTHWVDLASYSARQRRATPIGGFVGRATYAGDLTTELRELLVWGELLHVGKNAVKGDGLYRIEG